MLAGDLNAKHSFWYSAVSNPSGEKPFDLIYINEFEISAPQCPTHCSPAGNSDLFDIVAHQNIRFSGVTFSDNLDSDNLPIAFHILDHVKTKNISEPVEKFTDLERFQSLSSDLISARIEINSEGKAVKAKRNFTASISSEYRLSTIKVTLSDINNHHLPGLDLLLKHKQRLRKLW
jgi:hypothetical protein